MSQRLSAQEQLLRAVREDQWQTEVQNIALTYGWMYYHAPDNVPRKTKGGRSFVQNVRRGWPDLALLHPQRHLFMVAELKRETGTVSNEQAEWIAAFRDAGIRAEVWRPRDRELVTAILGPQAHGWARWPSRVPVVQP